jgi:hypothetical protein
MFSKKRTTATTTITTVTRPVASISTSSGPARPAVKVATKTIVSVRKVPAAPSPRPQHKEVIKRPAPPPPSSPRVNALKRKPEAPVKSKQQPAPKSSKSEGKKVERKPVVESSSEEEEESGTSGSEEAAADSDSGEDGTPMLGRKKEASPCVERDVSAALDGRVECTTGEKLVMESRKTYVDCELLSNDAPSDARELIARLQGSSTSRLPKSLQRSGQVAISLLLSSSILARTPRRSETALWLAKRAEN